MEYIIGITPKTPPINSSACNHSSGTLFLPAIAARLSKENKIMDSKLTDINQIIILTI
jgi:hypothetical protein